MLIYKVRHALPGLSVTKSRNMPRGIKSYRGEISGRTADVLAITSRIGPAAADLMPPAFFPGLNRQDSVQKQRPPNQIPGTAGTHTGPRISGDQSSSVAQALRHGSRKKNSNKD